MGQRADDGLVMVIIIPEEILIWNGMNNLPVQIALSCGFRTHGWWMGRCQEQRQWRERAEKSSHERKAEAAPLKAEVAIRRPRDAVMPVWSTPVTTARPIWCVRYLPACVSPQVPRVQR